MMIELHLEENNVDWSCDWLIAIDYTLNYYIVTRK
jgi:hypothetical protein